MEYTACKSPCASASCDDFRRNGALVKLCKEINCVEGIIHYIVKFKMKTALKESYTKFLKNNVGCQREACPPGKVYRNSTMHECIQPTECVCLEVNGVTYQENEKMSEDACHTW